MEIMPMNKEFFAGRNSPPYNSPIKLKNSTRKGAVFICILFCKVVDGKYCDSEDDEYSAGYAIECFRLGFVCKKRGNLREYQRAHDAYYKRLDIRRAADCKMADSAGQCGCAHNENACADGGFKLVTENGREEEKHHHSAARADKSAYKPDDDTADYGADCFLLCSCGFKSLFRRDDGLDYKLDTEEKRHEHGEIAHCCFRNKTCNIASDHCKAKNGNHHYNAVSDIKMFVFSICYGGHGACENVACEGYSDCHIRIHIKKCDEHGADYGCRAHSGKARAESGSEPCKYTYDNFKHCFVFPFRALLCFS